MTKPENPGKGNPNKGGKKKGDLKKAHVFRGAVVSANIESISLTVEKYNRSKDNDLSEVSVAITALTTILSEGEIVGVETLVPGTPVKVLAQALAGGGFVAKVIEEVVPKAEEPEEEPEEEPAL